jgi:hypothetical protein
VADGASIPCTKLEDAMKRNRKGTSARRETIHPWTYARAHAAIPYLTSLLRSLREHRLEALRHHLTARRLADQPGRPDSRTLIAREEARREARLADERFQEALDELQAIDVFCLHPIHGRALVPFVHEEQLAWFVFDLFDQEPMRFWRFHSDPMETRRPVTRAQKMSAEEPASLT